VRLPIVPQLSTKEGTSNKNARMTNVLKETRKTGEIAVVRPGLETSNTYSGIGNGLIPFDGRLLVIYDDTVTDTELDNSRPWELDALPWGDSITYYFGDVIWCNGVMKFSMADNNIGNACDASGTTYWSRSSSYDTYLPDESYAVGDTVVVNNVTYYSLAPSNVGNLPASSPYFWSTTPTTTDRWRGTVSGFAGSDCGSLDAAAYNGYQAYPYKSCATKFSATYAWLVFAGRSGNSILCTQYTDPAPRDCSGTAFISGPTSGYGTITKTA
jgi:hypothetical protein